MNIWKRNRYHISEERRKDMLTKNLSNLVVSILEKEKKLHKEIANMEKEEQEIRFKIKTLTKQIVEFQLKDDLDGKESCEKEIRNLKIRQSEIQDTLEAFRNHLEKELLTPREITKIRQAAIKENEARSSKLADLRDEKIKIEEQIQKFQKKLQRCEEEYLNTHNSRAEEKELMKIIRFIDLRAENLPHYEKDSFLKKWIAGENVEAFFKKSAVNHSLAITDR